jgi:hypothetical protein
MLLAAHARAERTTSTRSPGADAVRARLSAAAACASVAMASGAAEEEGRRSRARWAPALPHVTLRGHLGDGGFRRIDGDTLVTGETLTASRSVEIRLSWSLDELMYRSEELALARFEAERGAHAERSRHHCADLAARWLRLRLDPDRDEAEERAAFTALDIVTAGAMTRAEAARDAPAHERSP